MGAFLSEPVTDKISTDEEHERLSYGVCSMQGWRFTQEDNHSCFPSLDEKTSLFGVYDGHGGAEVSRYVASLLPDYVRERECWKEGEIGKALSEAFLALDAHLGSRKGLKVLKKLAAEDDAALDRDKNKSSADDDGDSEDSEENVRNLFKEAKMPLKVLMAKYGQALAAARNASDTSEDEEKESPSASKSPQGSKPKEEVSADVGGGSCAGPAKASKSDKEEEKEGGGEEEEEGGGEGAEEKPKENGLPDEDEKPTKNGSGERLKLRSRQNRIVYSDNEDDDDSSDEEYDENSSPLVEEGEGGEDEDESSGEEEEEDDDDDDDDDDEEDDELAGGLATSDEFALNMLQGPGLDSGCTAVVAVLEDGGALYVANAGDSRCILSRKGLAVDMSVDHKPEDEEESKRIMDAGGEVTSEGRVNGGLNLSRALGDHAYKQGKCGARKQMISALPDVRRIQLRKDEDEFMVLACDGIWNSMTSQEVVDFVRKRLYKKDSADELPSEMKERRKLSEGVKLSNICGEMFDYCLAPNTSGDGTGCDNMTAILVTFKEQMWKEGEGEEKGVAEEKMAVTETEDGPKEEGGKEHGIVLLTPPPSPPQCIAMEDEEEESSEEDEEEEAKVKVKEEAKVKVKEEVKVKVEEEAKKIKEEVEEVKKVKEEVVKVKEEAKKIKEEVEEVVKVKKEVNDDVKSSGLGKGCKRLASKDSPTKGKKQKVEEEAS